jgi:diguanylate cyclase (GGDEF)-like protein/PAS domain S-box-containing protein
VDQRSDTALDAGRSSDQSIDPLGLLDLSSELAFAVSASGMLRYANRAWRETLGYAADEVSRLLILDIVKPEHEQALSAVMRDVAQQRAPRPFTTTLLARTGEVVPVTGRMEFLQAGAQPEMIVAVMRDLRAERELAAELDEVRAQFQSAFESPAIGMAIQGLDGRWQAVNEAFATIVGYPPAELLRMTFQDITHPDDLDRNAELLQQLMTGEERRFQMEKRYINRDGATVSVILTVSAVIGSDGATHRFISQIQDVTARRQLETQLLHRASHDVLTGLPNRALFMDRLEHALDRLQRDGGQIAVMFLDLDGFKAVNDQYGHEQGDRLLVEIGRRLRACARAGDTVARLGGDEFTILLENIRHPSVATQVGQRVLETLRYPIMLGEDVTTITPSIGIALSVGSDDRADTMLHAADTAMYAAKRAGKDRTVVAQRGST